MIKGQEIISAVQEERFSRIKHDSKFPIESIKYCLKEGNIDPKDLEHIVFYDKPFLKFERILETSFAFAPLGFKSFYRSMPLWIKDKLFQKSLISKELNELFGDQIDWKRKLLFSEHHLSHAASAFYPSPFKRAAILTMDGVGEWSTTSLSIGNSNKISIQKEIHFPHSIGLLYSAFTYYCGFKVNSGEYKLMGLSPYGEPKYANLIKEKLIDIKEDGSFHLDMSYFDYCTGLTMTSKKFDNLFGGSPRKPESEITKKEMDLASSIQRVTEEIVLKLLKEIRRDSGEENLCLAGGVALNCVVNGILLNEKIFKNIWIQPAAGDAGGALGSALAVYHLMLGGSRKIISNVDSMKGSLLGPSFSRRDILKTLESSGAVYTEFTKKEVVEKTAEYIHEGKIVGWMNGRMEFGPRALGSRSILADPRSPKMQKQLNLKVKNRESFRPFAPSVIEEEAKEWFKLDAPSPYMLFVSEIQDRKKNKIKRDEELITGFDSLDVERSVVPAVTHVDYSARVQTVNSRDNSLYHELISNFKKLSGCPILVNTSFNVRGEPIVCSPEDALSCFMNTDIDILVIGNFILEKEKQSAELKDFFERSYELD